MDKKEKEKKTFWQELPEYIVIMAVTVLVCTCVICLVSIGFSFLQRYTKNPQLQNIYCD